MVGGRTYRSALAETADSDMIYPSLTGHAEFALPYIGRLARLMTKPQYSNPTALEYWRVAVRDTADDFTFTAEFARATRFYRANRSKWTDEEADAIGADYLRAYRDMVPANAEDVPF